MDLLGSLNSDSKWLSIEFWLSEAALLRSQNLPARVRLNGMLQAMCESIIDVGAFTFPPPPRAVEHLQGAETRAARG